MCRLFCLLIIAASSFQCAASEVSIVSFGSEAATTPDSTATNAWVGKRLNECIPYDRIVIVDNGIYPQHLKESKEFHGQFAAMINSLVIQEPPEEKVTQGDSPDYYHCLLLSNDAIVGTVAILNGSKHGILMHFFDGEKVVEYAQVQVDLHDK